MVTVKATHEQVVGVSYRSPGDAVHIEVGHQLDVIARVGGITVVYHIREVSELLCGVDEVRILSRSAAAAEALGYSAVPSVNRRLFRIFGIVGDLGIFGIFGIIGDLGIVGIVGIVGLLGIIGLLGCSYTVKALKYELAIFCNGPYVIEVEVQNLVEPALGGEIVDACSSSV